MTEKNNIEDTHEISGQVDYAVKKKYKWISESGKNTCEKCKSLDGKIFDLEDLPKHPHPNCKCRVEEISIVAGSVAKLHGYRDEKFNLELDAKEILGDLSVIKKKIHEDLDNIKYSEIEEKKEKLLSDIQALEIEVNRYIDRLPELSRLSDEEMFQQKISDLSSLRDNFINIRNLFEQVKLQYGFIEKEGLMTGGAANITQDIIESPTIAGVKKGKPMSFEQASGEQINPHYYKNDVYKEEYYDNCVCCVLALEARLRGYKVHAAGQFFEGKLNELSEHPFWAWIDKETGEKCEGQSINNVQTTQELIDVIETIVEINQRYHFVYYQEQILDNVGTTISAHIICIDRNEKGELRFYDPQNDRLRQGENIEGFIEAQIDLLNSEYKPVILRVDNKIINPEFADEALIAD